jgi:Cof subfamily protein (haloacid dehalogenase superfamily)
MTREATVYVTDLDGTLLNEDALLSERTREGLTALLAEGMKLTVATARNIVSMRPILEGLEIPLPVVDMNGAFVSDLRTGEHLMKNTLKAETAADLCDWFRSSGRDPFVSTLEGASDHLYYSSVGNPGMGWYVADRTRNGDDRLRRTDDLESALKEEVVCLTVIDRPEVIAELRLAVCERHADALTVRHFGNEYFADWDWLTVHDGRARKDKALGWLMRERDLDACEVVAMGDSDSDVPLFRMAHRGIAVANATPEAKAAATELIGSNTDDSVVAFLERDWAGA